MTWTADYLELLEEYSKLCNVDSADMKKHIDNDSLGFQQFKEWADCLPVR